MPGARGRKAASGTTDSLAESAAGIPAPLPSETALTPALLIVTAVPAEADAVLAGLAPAGSPPAEPVTLGPYRGCRSVARPEVTVLAGGIGPAAAAAATAAVLALNPGFTLVLSAGIAGGFDSAGVRIADVVLATGSVFADLGAHSPAGFLPAAELGWTGAAFPGPVDMLPALAERIGRAGLAVHAGPILTVCTVTGTSAGADRLSTAHRPVAEAMEGAAVAGAADRWGRSFLELRAVSNLVGDRDPASWDLPAALHALSSAVAAALPVLLPETP